MPKLGHTISNTLSLLGQVSPWAKRASGNIDECPIT